MSLLQPAENQQAFAKVGILGFAGSGKTFTAALIAKGIIDGIGGKSVAFFDTETGSDFLVSSFKESDIDLRVAKSRAFTDLLSVIKDAEASDAVLIIDSITHVWRELCDTYQKKKGVARLQFHHWAEIKGEWQEYTDLFVNSNLHIIVCGRAGYEWDFNEDEEGHKELIKTATKMKVETEFGFEPSLMIEMERLTPEKDKGESVRVGSKWIHRAHILKDRADKINGAHFDYPVFENFVPHFDALNIGGKHLGCDTDRTSDDLFNSDGNGGWKEKQIRRGVALDQVKESLVLIWPGQSAVEKKAKIKMLELCFGTISWTEISEKLSLETVEAGGKILYGFTSYYKIPEKADIKDAEKAFSKFADVLVQKAEAEQDDLPM